MSDSSSSHSEHSPWADKLMDSLLRQSACHNDKEEEDFLQSVEAAIDQVEKETVIPLPSSSGANTFSTPLRSLFLRSAAVAAVFLVFLAGLSFFVPSDSRFHPLSFFPGEKEPTTHPPGGTEGTLPNEPVKQITDPNGERVPQIAQEYVVRIQEELKLADEAALRGGRLMNDGDYQGAIDHYRTALDILPDAPMTETRRRVYTVQFARAGNELAKQRADEGRYPESIAIVEEVLHPGMDPNNREAQLLLDQLGDPDYYSPAQTPEQLELITRVKQAVTKAKGYLDLGDYHRAKQEYNQALEGDPSLQAAHEGLEETERLRIKYFDAAYDQTRAKILREIQSGWESVVPDSSAAANTSNLSASTEPGGPSAVNKPAEGNATGLSPDPSSHWNFHAVAQNNSGVTRASGGTTQNGRIVLQSPTLPGETSATARGDQPADVSIRGGSVRSEKEGSAFESHDASFLFRDHFQRPPATESTASRYGELIDNAWQSPLQDPLSTFSIDVDTASMSNVRGLIRQGATRDQIPRDSVRIEELVNYFDWDYPQPDSQHPFAFAAESAECPWNKNHQILRVGVQGKEVLRRKRPDANLVFLLDVSGSMDKPDKLPLVKRAISVLVEELKENDCVSIVVYAGSQGLALPTTSGAHQAAITSALDQLDAGGSTNGGAGIKLAYKIAQEQFIEGGINRVILCTDGDFNVGLTEDEDLVQLVETKAEGGVFLSVCGFGTDNLNDAMLEEITNRGNGNYYYIDTFSEARKVFLKDMMGTLVTIAKDVKIQVEFNPGKVAAYRLIGYANRRLEAEDFDNDEVDAGEVGAGHSVTALYEVIPVGADNNPAVAGELRYQKPVRPERELIDSDELALLKLRYKKPDSDTSILMTEPVESDDQSWRRASSDFRFASAVGLFGLILREHESAQDSRLRDVINLAGKYEDNDPHGYRKEFIFMVNKLMQNEEKK